LLVDCYLKRVLEFGTNESMPTNNEPLGSKEDRMIIVTTVMATGWILASILGTWAYFAGEGIIDQSQV
jgi:hypothetical protein